ncbi:hypothetical protein ABGB17_29760 [Sphaerisporangium sp. B11E5]|uniref:hypothetical protein n=1 Tax=Sphaerisporangium sp. B11E5 TaxID=3153563 RepID=UPI00325E2A9B
MRNQFRRSGWAGGHFEQYGAYPRLPCRPLIQGERMRRCSWEDLSEQVRAAVLNHTGPVAVSVAVERGEHPDFRAVLDTEAGPVFVKGMTSSRAPGRDPSPEGMTLRGAAPAGRAKRYQRHEAALRVVAPVQELATLSGKPNTRAQEYGYFFGYMASFYVEQIEQAPHLTHRPH